MAEAGLLWGTISQVNQSSGSVFSFCSTPNNNMDQKGLGELIFS